MAASKPMESRVWEARLDLDASHGEVTDWRAGLRLRVRAELRGESFEVTVSEANCCNLHGSDVEVAAALEGPPLRYTVDAGSVCGGGDGPREGLGALLGWLGDVLTAAILRPDRDQVYAAEEDEIRLRRVDDGRTMFLRGPAETLANPQLVAPVRGTVEWSTAPLPDRIRAHVELQPAHYRPLLSALDAARIPTLGLGLRIWLRPIDEVEAVGPPAGAEALAPFSDPASMLPVRRGALLNLIELARGVSEPEATRTARALVAACEGPIEALLAVQRAGASAGIRLAARAPKRPGMCPYTALFSMACGQLRLELEAGGQPLDRCVDLVRALGLIGRRPGDVFQDRLMRAALAGICVDAIAAAPTEAFAEARRRLEVARDWRRVSPSPLGRRHFAGMMADFLIRLMDAVEVGRAEEAWTVSTWQPAGFDSWTPPPLVLVRCDGRLQRPAQEPPQSPAPRPIRGPAPAHRHRMQRVATVLSAAGFAARGPVWGLGGHTVELGVRDTQEGARLWLVERVGGQSFNLIAFMPERTQRALDALRSSFGLPSETSWAQAWKARRAGWPVMMAPRVVDGQAQGHLSNGVHIHVALPPEREEEALTQLDAVLAEGLAEALAAAEADRLLAVHRLPRDVVHLGGGSLTSLEALARERAVERAVLAWRRPREPRRLPISAEVDEGDFGLEPARRMHAADRPDDETLRAACALEGRRLAVGVAAGVEILSFPEGELRARMVTEGVAPGTRRWLHFLGRRALLVRAESAVKVLELETGTRCAPPSTGLLCMVGRWSARRDSRGLRIVDGLTGRVIFLDLPGELLAVGAGGRVLLMHGGEVSVHSEAGRLWSQAVPVTTEAQARRPRIRWKPPTPSLQASFSPQGRRAAFLAGGDAWVVDLEEDQASARRVLPSALGLRFASKGVLLVAPVEEGTEVIYLDLDLRLRAPWLRLDRTCFSPDGLTAWGGWACDVPTAREATPVHRSFAPATRPGGLLEDGGVLLVSGGRARIWDTETLALRVSHAAPGRLLAVSSGARKVILQPHDRSRPVCVMDTGSGALGPGLPARGMGLRAHVADEGTALVATLSQTVIACGDARHVLDGRPKAEALSADGRFVVLVGRRWIRVRRAADASLVAETEGGRGVAAVAISRDGGLVAFARPNGGATLWRVGESERVDLGPAEGLFFTEDRLFLEHGGALSAVDPSTLARSEGPENSRWLAPGAEGAWARFEARGVRLERREQAPLEIQVFGPNWVVTQGDQMRRRDDGFLKVQEGIHMRSLPPPTRSTGELEVEVEPLCFEENAEPGAEVRIHVRNLGRGAARWLRLEQTSAPPYVRMMPLGRLRELPPGASGELLAWVSYVGPPPKGEIRFDVHQERGRSAGGRLQLGP